MSRSKLYQEILSHLSKGGAVQISTALKAFILKPKHKDRIKLQGESLYIARGKRWDCIDYCHFRFSR
jgi:hypothetical protein